MMDLRGYLRKLDRPGNGWAASGEQRGLGTNACATSDLESNGRREERRWPQLAGGRGRGTDAVLVRARLSNYQRALTSARKTLQVSHRARVFPPVGASLFITNSDGGADSGSSAERGVDQ